MRRAALVLVLVLLAAGAQARQPANPWDNALLSVAPAMLNPKNPAQMRVGALTWAGGLFLFSPGTERFNGLSGLEAIENGGMGIGFTAVTDGGDFVTFNAVHDEKGMLSRAWGLTLTGLYGEDRQPLQGKTDGDAEDISKRDGAPGYLVSFERRHRIVAYDDPRSPRAAVHRENIPADIKDAPENEGMEAVAALPGGYTAIGVEDGRIWICPPTQQPCVKVNESKGPRWGYKLTGFDTIPGTSQLIAVWRRRQSFSRRDFDTMITHAAVKDGHMRFTVLAELKPPLATANMEGVAVLPIPGGGGWRIYLISDNNGEPKTPTWLMAFDWRG